MAISCALDLNLRPQDDRTSGEKDGTADGLNYAI